MRAVVLESYGEPEVLTVRDVPDPDPGPEEVVVDIVATALNRADLLQRRGFYPGPPMAHEIPGMELSGRVAAVGERATLWQVGRRGDGHRRWRRLRRADRRARTSAHGRARSSVGVADGAAIPEVWITAFDALVAQGGLTSGGTALVHAGGSGVGTAAIQIAKAIGARVLVTASAGKVAACLELGADAAIDYAVDDFVAVTRDLTDGRGADVVLDVIGGDYVDRNIAAVAVGGRIIQVGVMGGGVTSVNVGMLLPKRAALIGTVLRARPLEEKIAITRRFAAQILPFFDAGVVHPVIDRRYPLDAHRRGPRRHGGQRERGQDPHRRLTRLSDTTRSPARGAYVRWRAWTAWPARRDPVRQGGEPSSGTTTRTVPPRAETWWASSSPRPSFGRPVRPERAVGRAGDRVLVDARAGAEEPRHDVEARRHPPPSRRRPGPAPGAAARKSGSRARTASASATSTRTSVRPRARASTPAGSRPRPDQQTVGRLRADDGGGRVGREVELDPAAGQPGGGEPAAAGVEAQLVVGHTVVGEQVVRRGQRGVAAQVDLDRGGEPAQAPAALDGGTRKAVSDRFISAATACIHAGVGRLVEQHHARPGCRRRAGR